MPAIDLAELVDQLVAINSANPSTSSAGRGERELADWCVNWLSARGVHASTQAVAGPGRPAVLAHADGTRGGRRLLLLGHLDTRSWYVPAVRRTATRIWGPGVSDMKAGIAIILAVTARFRALGLRGSLLTVLTPDEEHASCGVRALAEVLEADGAALLESTGLQLVTQQSGSVRCWARPQRADDIVRLAGAAHGVMRITEVSRVDGQFLVELRRSVSPGEDAAVVHRKIAPRIDAAYPRGANWDLRESFWTDPADPLVAVFAKGVQVSPRELHGWTEAGVLAARGIPTVIFGPTGGGEHTTGEWVARADLDTAHAIVTDAVEEYCA
jgi:acetylornithine deacetylase